MTQVVTSWNEPARALPAGVDSNFNTKLTPSEENAFKAWKAKYAPNDSGDDYDLRGAFKAGLKPDPKTGHWPDTFKKPNEPTFSNESIYAAYGKPGHWAGPNHDQYVPWQAPSASQKPPVVSSWGEKTPVKSLVSRAADWVKTTAPAAAHDVVSGIETMAGLSSPAIAAKGGGQGAGLAEFGTMAVPWGLGIAAGFTGVANAIAKAAAGEPVVPAYYQGQQGAQGLIDKYVEPVLAPESPTGKAIAKGFGEAWKGAVEDPMSWMAAHGYAKTAALGDAAAQLMVPKILHAASSIGTFGGSTLAAAIAHARRAAEGRVAPEGAGTAPASVADQLRAVRQQEAPKGPTAAPEGAPPEGAAGPAVAPAAPQPFNPTPEWQPVPPHAVLPPGLEIRMNMQTGINEARVRPPTTPTPATPAGAPPVMSDWGSVTGGEHVDLSTFFRKPVADVKTGALQFLARGDSPMSKAAQAELERRAGGAPAEPFPEPRVGVSPAPGVPPPESTIPAPAGAALFVPKPGDPLDVPRHALPGAPIIYVPTRDLMLSEDVPNFKAGANSKGVVEPLTGKFDYTGLAPVQVWQRLNGDLEVVSGRHRLDLAQRNGPEIAPVMPAQIHREADGFDVKQAQSLDAILNIRDGQGSVADYANYFKAAGIEEAAAKSAGLLDRAKGKNGFTIARDAGPEVFAAHRAGLLSDEAAVEIAKAAPQNAALQAVGLKLVNENKPISLAVNTMRALSLMPRGEAQPEQGDIFGFDDSLIKEQLEVAKRAAAAQREIREQLAAVSGATKRPEIARKLGVDVKDPEAVQAKIAELRAEAERMQNWPLHPDLVARFGGRQAPVGEVPAQNIPENIPSAAPEDAVQRAIDQRDARFDYFKASKAIADAKTGQPFTQTLIRGEGAPDSPYNALGPGEPILGPGRYTTSDPKFAEEFGPNTTEVQVHLENPLVIKTEDEWRNLTRKKAGWEFPNPLRMPGPGAKAKTSEEIHRLRSLLEEEGHDGVIVDVPESEAEGKLLQKVFGGSQVVEFNPPGVDTQTKSMFQPRATYDAGQGGLFEEKTGAKPEQPKGDTDANLARSRPKQMIIFSKPYVGKTGAKLVGYEWKWRSEDIVDKRGEDKTIRVSDWEESITNPETNRDIVHQFQIEKTDGEVVLVSAETAAKQLGVSQSTARASAKRLLEQEIRNQQQAAKAQAEAESFDRMEAAATPAEAISNNVGNFAPFVFKKAQNEGRMWGSEADRYTRDMLAKREFRFMVKDGKYAFSPGPFSNMTETAKRGWKIVDLRADQIWDEAGNDKTTGKPALQLEGETEAQIREREAAAKTKASEEAAAAAKADEAARAERERKEIAERSKGAGFELTATEAVDKKTQAEADARRAEADLAGQKSLFQKRGEYVPTRGQRVPWIKDVLGTTEGDTKSAKPGMNRVSVKKIIEPYLDETGKVRHDSVAAVERKIGRIPTEYRNWRYADEMRRATDDANRLKSPEADYYDGREPPIEIDPELFYLQNRDTGDIVDGPFKTADKARAAVGENTQDRAVKGSDIAGQPQAREKIRGQDPAGQLDLFSEVPIKGSRARAFEKIVVEPEKVGERKISVDRVPDASYAAAVFQDLTRSPMEKFQVLGLDHNDKPIAFFDMFAGTVNQTSVYPREVWTAIYQTPGVRSVWIAHQHPSGLAVPSHADQLLTKSLQAALKPNIGVELKGHLIITRGGAVNIGPTGDELNRITPAVGMQPRTIPIMERVIKSEDDVREILQSPQAVRNFFRLFDPKETGLLFLDSQNKAVSWLPMNIDSMAKLRTGDVNTGMGALMNKVGRSNAAAAIAYSPGPATPAFETGLRNVGSALQLADVKMLDAITTPDAGIEAQTRNPSALQAPPTLQSHAEMGRPMTLPNLVNFNIGLTPKAMAQGVGAVADLAKAALRRAQATKLGAAASEWGSAVLEDARLKTVPMAAGSDAARAIAKDFANADRLSRWQWARFDDIIKKNYTPEQQQKMWDAGEEENQLRLEEVPQSERAGRGLDKLTPEERKTMDTLQEYGDALLHRARDVGMFRGEGVKYWVPRMVAMIGKDGEVTRPKAKGGIPEGPARSPYSSPSGGNITTQASSLKQRKYATAAETEAAAKTKFGEEAYLARNIRTMPMAMARIERAIAGRELINAIKEFGKDTGQETVAEAPKDGYFTIDHPAFKTYRYRPDLVYKEAWDRQMWDQQIDFARSIGVEPERVLSMRGGTWGWAKQGTGEVQTRFGGPETVLTHELGHQLDFKYGLVNKFFGGDRPKSDFILERQIAKAEREGNTGLAEKYRKQMTINGEMRDLADLRFEGQEATDYYRKYVRKGTEKMANMVHAYVHAPEKFKAVAPTAYREFKSFIANHPELAQLDQIKPSLTLTSGGFRKRPPGEDFDVFPVWVSKEFEGPLKSIMTDQPGKLYSAMMAAKGKSMSVIMYSPLIHNGVEWGRALPAMPGKVATFKIYFEGNVAKNNPEIMAQAIQEGLVPIGHRFFMQDITGLLETPEMKPGRSWTAKLAGGAVGLVSKGAGEAVKRGIDTAGDFWHNTLLWDRVADLQMGLYSNFKAQGIRDGLDPQTAGRLASHMANRFAGALPNEAMSANARKLANFVFFSRTFTLGNLGVMKDMMTGLPRDVQAQIGRDAGEVARFAAKGEAQRVAISAFTKDIALMYIANSAMQSGFDYLKRDKTLSEIEKGYVDRFDRMLKKTQESPTDLLKPFNELERLTPMSENEPGKEYRVLYDYEDTGTGIYVRLPTGKIGEEFLSWATSPLDILKRKEGTVMRPLIQIFNNDRGFGRQVYNPDLEGYKGAFKAVGRSAMLLLSSQIPGDTISSAIDIARQKGDENDAMKVVGPLFGLTFSKGAPGGPEVGEMYQIAREHRAEVSEIMPDVKKLLKHGDNEDAVKLMYENHMTPEEIRMTLRFAAMPRARLSPQAMKKFILTAPPEELERMQRMRENQP